MKILLIFGESLYDYQKQILVALLDLKDVEIFCCSCDHKCKISKDSKLFSIINSKFPVVKTNPFSFENTVHFIANSTSTKKYNEDLYYDYVLNFCETTIINEFKIKFGHVLKTADEIRSWYSACINEFEYTTINLLLSSDNQNFVPFRSLSFSTEKGIYNNRNKAFYYFSFLIKSIFSDKKYAVAKSIKKDYSLVKNILYHAKLAKITFLRKFPKSQLNWKIAVLKNNEPQIITDEPGAFWADPFIVKDRQNNWIFFEEFDYQTNLGKISVINLQENISLKKQVVLEKPYHLSFPNVFKVEDNYFMMPEESASEEQNIYKATAFPYQWEKFKTIFKNMKVVDPIFIFYNQKYWLFFNKIENFEYENNERLYLYFADDLFSDQWVSHPQNPIIIDKSNARNAGNITKESNQLIRVSQNCKNSYGENISKNRITELSETIYREDRVLPNWDFNTFHGFHTINSKGNMTIIDLLIKEVK